MDIFTSLKSISLGALLIPIATFVLNINASSTSIFDVLLSPQVASCESFVNPKNQSITDPDIKYPPQNHDKSNYEYIITTPNYANTYPTNIECIALIKAPNYDYQIMIEGRERFEVEYSKECRNDFLEIIDGPFGFMEKIGRYCDANPLPKEIISSGPFLWLRFVSDSNIAKSGFKLVYRFAKRRPLSKQKHYCYKKLNILPGSSIILNHSFALSLIKQTFKIDENSEEQLDTSTEIINPYECVIDINVSPKYYTFVYLNSIKPKKQADCKIDFIDIHHRNTKKLPAKPPKSLSDFYHVCSENDFEQRLFVKSTRTVFRFSFSTLKKTSRFVFHITSMIKNRECPPDYFKCQDDLCIHNSLKCNKQRNCPGESDEKCYNNDVLKPGQEPNITATTPKSKTTKDLEEKALAKKRSDTMHGIILGSMAAVLIIFFIVCFLLTMHSRKKERMKVQSGTTPVTENHTNPLLNKKLYYEQLHMSEPSIAALSTDKSIRKVYDDQSVWSRRVYDDNDAASRSIGGGIGNRLGGDNTSVPLMLPDDPPSMIKLNGGIATTTGGITAAPPDISTSSATNNKTTNSFLKNQRLKRDKSKNTSLNKIGKYLSEPNPPKNESFITSTTTISNATTTKPQSHTKSSTNNSSRQTDFYNPISPPSTTQQRFQKSINQVGNSGVLKMPFGSPSDELRQSFSSQYSSRQPRQYHDDTDETHQRRHPSNSAHRHIGKIIPATSDDSSSNHYHIQRATSMGSGLRKILDKECGMTDRHHLPTQRKRNHPQYEHQQYNYVKQPGGVSNKTPYRSNSKYYDDDDDDDEDVGHDENVDWYCGPVIRGPSSGSFNEHNRSSEMILPNDLSHSGESSHAGTQNYACNYNTSHIPGRSMNHHHHHNDESPTNSMIHVPGCRSLPNVTQFGLLPTSSNTCVTPISRSPVAPPTDIPRYYTKPPPNNYPEMMTDYSEEGMDEMESSSYRGETPTLSSRYINNSSSGVNPDVASYKHSTNNNNNNNNNSNFTQYSITSSNKYGLKYYCAHEPLKLNNNHNDDNNDDDDFVEYIA